MVTILGIWVVYNVAILAGHRYQLNQIKQDYADYVANRIVFQTSTALNAKEE